MKKTIISILLSFLILFAFTLTPNKAEAYWYANARIFVNPGLVKAEVYNGLDKQIYCRGKVYGLTRSGHWISSWGETVINPGYHAYWYVYSDARRNPFVDGKASIQCRYR